MHSHIYIIKLLAFFLTNLSLTANSYLQLVTRIEALEGMITGCGPSREDFIALISELAMLNSNVKALTEMMVSNLKHTQNNVQPDSKADEDKFLEANTLNGTTRQIHPLGSHCEPEAAERTHCYKRVQPGSRIKDVIRTRSPPHLEAACNMTNPPLKNTPYVRLATHAVSKR